MQLQRVATSLQLYLLVAEQLQLVQIPEHMIHRHIINLSCVYFRGPVTGGLPSEQTLSQLADWLPFSCYSTGFPLACANSILTLSLPNLYTTAQFEACPRLLLPQWDSLTALPNPLLLDSLILGLLGDILFVSTLIRNRTQLYALIFFQLRIRNGSLHRQLQNSDPPALQPPSQHQTLQEIQTASLTDTHLPFHRGCLARRGNHPLAAPTLPTRPLTHTHHPT